MTGRALPAVLILDSSPPASLAACRALGRSRRYRVGVAGIARNRVAAGPVAVSRYANRYDTLPDPLGPADAFEEALRRVVRRRGYDVVLSTDDAHIARLASVQVPVSTFPSVGAGFRALVDKVGLQDLCERVGVPYPETRSPASAVDVSDAADGLGLPIVVKSAQLAGAGPGAVRLARGATVCRDLAAVQAAVRGLEDVGLQPIMQPRIRSAEKLNAVVIRRDGVSELRYAHRVLRETPITGGIGVTLVTIDAMAGPGSEAVGLLERVCDAAGYRGLAQAEFYRSADDGRLYLLDVNPRLWGSTWFAERLGLQVVERGVRFALGKASLPPRPYQLGRTFHQPVGEWRWLRQQRAMIPAIGSLVRTTRPGDVFDYVDWRDPLPVAAYAVLALYRRTEAARRGG